MTFESNEQMIDYLYSLRRMNIKLGLDNINYLMKVMDHPEKSFPSIHVAGTNGKGSTCAILESIYRAAGYKTGRYTSPHLVDVNERIQVNGKRISLYFIKQKLEKIYSAVKTQRCSFFEVLTAMAFSYFQDQEVEIAIVEVGMGGRLDATNVLSPLAAIITEIDLDHQKQLGKDPKQIAGEKAGIIKSGIKVIANISRSEVLDHVESISKEKQAIFTSATAGVKIDHVKSTAEGTCFNLQTPVNEWKELVLSLPGKYQIRNAITDIRTTEILIKDLPFQLHAIPNGLQSVQWPGRLQVLQNNPIVIADVGHNFHGVTHTIAEINSIFPNRKITCIFGVLAAKNYHDMIECLNTYVDLYIAVTPKDERALTAEKLAKAIRRSGKKVIVMDSPQGALQNAIQICEPQDIICILGSHFNLEEILKNHKNA